MRTTIDLPDDLLRRAKAVAALRGVKLKDLVASILAQGLADPPEPPAAGHNRPTPVTISSDGRQIASLTNTELEALLLREDIQSWGFDRPASGEEFLGIRPLPARGVVVTSELVERFR